MAERALTVAELGPELDDVEAEATGWLYTAGAGPYLAGVFGIWVGRHREAVAHMTLSDAKREFDGHSGWQDAAEEYRQRECARKGHQHCAA